MSAEKQKDRFAALLPALHRRARRLCACPDEAADLAQEAALKLWQQDCRGARFDNHQAYAMTILHNLARSRWRTRKDWTELTDEMAATLPEAPARLACADLARALSRLPPKQALLMRHVVLGETSPARLARITGQPAGTVMSRLARARVALRRELDLEKSAPSRALIGEP